MQTMWWRTPFTPQRCLYERRSSMSRSEKLSRSSRSLRQEDEIDVCSKSNIAEYTEYANMLPSLPMSNLSFVPPPSTSSLEIPPSTKCQMFHLDCKPPLRNKFSEAATMNGLSSSSCIYLGTVWLWLSMAPPSMIRFPLRNFNKRR